MVDIHTHILPGIDDGARNWEDTYRMAAMAADCGVDTIVCSHHANIPGLFRNYHHPYLDDLFQELKERLEVGGFPLKVVRGMEIFCTEDVLDKIARGLLLPINGSQYYLLEFDFFADTHFMEYCLMGLMDLGYTPVMAHPERYISLQNNVEVLQDWMAEGVLTQVNRGSLQGRFGQSCEYAAREFMKRDLVTCLASDAHGVKSRTTEMRQIYEQISREYSPQKAADLLERNPRKIVAGQRIKM